MRYNPSRFLEEIPEKYGEIHILSPYFFVFKSFLHSLTHTDYYDCKELFS
jgi:hypothetical protein